MPPTPKHGYCNGLRVGKQAWKRKLFYIRSSETCTCPLCDNELGVIGSRKRTLIQADGTEIKLIIRRLKCRGKNCSRIHHELPDRVVPYKRHESETIEQIITSADETKTTHPCEAATVYRIKVWFSLLREYFENSIQALKELYRNNAVLYGKLCALSRSPDGCCCTAGWLKCLVRILVNSGRWQQTRSVYAVR